MPSQERSNFYYTANGFSNPSILQQMKKSLKKTKLQQFNKEKSLHEWVA